MRRVGRDSSSMLAFHSPDLNAAFAIDQKIHICSTSDASDAFGKKTDGG